MSDDIDEKAAARVGSVLNDKWTLERLVGVGGMAAVYAAKHRNGARAAVKVLHPNLSAIPEVRERFLREGYAANKVDHPGAVKVLDDDTIREGPDEGATYLVMELLDGASLEDRIERGPPIGELELMRIVRAVLEVLEAAHAAGVIHRDLKPDNLLILAESEPSECKVKVLDFGLARLAESRIRTQAGLALGTPSYMPPEQAAGRVDEIDARTDLFAVGATAFRILTGRTIHPGSNAVEIALKMASEPAPPVRSLAPHVNASVAAIVDRACAFKREDRYPSATAMLADVRAAIAAIDQTSGAITAQMPVPVAAPPGAPKLPKPASGSIHVPGLPTRRRRRSMVPLVSVLVALGVAAQITLDAMQPPAATTITETDAGSLVVEEATVDAGVAVSAPVADAGELDASETQRPQADAGEDAGEEGEDAGVPDASPHPTLTRPKDASAPHPTIKPTSKPTSKPPPKKR